MVYGVGVVVRVENKEQSFFQLGCQCGNGNGLEEQPLLKKVSIFYARMIHLWRIVLQGPRNNCSIENDSIIFLLLSFAKHLSEKKREK